MHYPHRKQQTGIGLAASLAASLTLFTATVESADLDDLNRQAVDRVEQTSKAERTVAGLDKESQQMVAEYQQLLMEAKQLSAYNKLVSTQVANQEKDINTLEQTIDNSRGLEQRLLPIVTDMISSLEDFVSLDKPFLVEDRRRAVAALQDSLEDPADSLAVTLRRVLETYQAELDYGRNIESWREQLATGDNSREVDMLRIGRLTLLYRSLDRKELGIWNPDAGEWQRLAANEWNRAFDQANKIARKQAAPDLLTVPVFTASSDFDNGGLKP